MDNIFSWVLPNLIDRHLQELFNKDRNKQIRVFLSYSHYDETLVKRIATCFEKCTGFAVFYSGGDLDLGEEDYIQILNHLNKADYIIPLISENFKCSPFANQEIGIAKAKNKKIIPLTLGGIDPFGFIQHRQAYKFDSCSEDEILEAVTKIFFLPFDSSHYTRYKLRAMESLTCAFEHSDHFRTTSILIGTMLQIHQAGKAKFANNQITRIINAARKNPQIHYANEILMPKLAKFLKDYYNKTIDF